MTTEHLDHHRRIDAHLANLLDIAAKRTPGEWATRSNTERMDYGKPIRVESNKPPFSVAYHGSEDCFLSAGDAAFIAAAAGNAEAGWKATRAAIAEILSAHEAAYEGWCLVSKELGKDPGSLEDYPLPPWSQHILAAFPNV